MVFDVYGMNWGIIWFWIGGDDSRVWRELAVMFGRYGPFCSYELLILKLIWVTRFTHLSVRVQEEEEERRRKKDERRWECDPPVYVVTRLLIGHFVFLSISKQQQPVSHAPSLAQRSPAQPNPAQPDRLDPVQPKKPEVRLWRHNNMMI